MPGEFEVTLGFDTEADRDRFVALVMMVCGDADIRLRPPPPKLLELPPSAVSVEKQ